VSGAYRLELVLVVLAAAVAIGMILHRQLAIGGLDRRPVRIAGDAENLVKICFHRWHAWDPAPTSAATVAHGDGDGSVVIGRSALVVFIDFRELGIDDFLVAGRSGRGFLAGVAAGRSGSSLVLLVD